jgi:hypothetical protein
MAESNVEMFATYDVMKYEVLVALALWWDGVLSERHAS